jgi:hypothetical protein
VTTEFDETIDPLPLANKLILNGGKALPEEVDFLARALLHAHVKVDALYNALDKKPGGPQKLCDLWNHVAEFIKKQNIHCVETVYQSDRVILNAYDFIAECCNIVGYIELDD